MIEKLRWLAGDWQGSLGPQMVDENWSEPFKGHMQARVRIGSHEEGATTIELLSIRETGDSLVLLVRQFSPALEPVNSQDLELEELGDHSVRFSTDTGGIIGLKYSQPQPDQLEVQVTLAGGDAVTASLKRP